MLNETTCPSCGKRTLRNTDGFLYCRECYNPHRPDPIQKARNTLSEAGLETQPLEKVSSVAASTQYL